MFSRVKKLVFVLANFMLVIEAYKEDYAMALASNPLLKYVLGIYHLVRFKKRSSQSSGSPRLR